MTVVNNVKPDLWLLDPTAVDPLWARFWERCIACIPAWENAVGAVPMILSGCGAVSLGVSQTLFMTKVGNAAWAADFQGPGLINTDASTDDWTIASPTGTSDIIPTNRVTYLMLRRPQNTTISSQRSFGRNLASGGASTAAGGHVPFSDGIVYWDFGQQSGANRITWSGYTPGTTIEAWAFVAGTQGSAIYFQGNKVASQATALTRLNSGSSAISLYIGQGGPNSNATNYQFFAILDDEWTPGMVADWTADPFGPLRINTNDSSTGTGPGQTAPKLPLLGTGKLLPVMVGWRAARAVIKNPTLSRRGLIIPRRFHND